jgi:ABC-type sugar transport system ATPase subunit
MPGVLLRAESICKAFAGIEALRSVSFGLSAGESHALVGENGAGKSTLIKIITGAVETDSGVLTICGEVIARNSPSVARSLGIAAIYQQPSSFPDLSVTENIALALETGGAWKPVDWRARREKAEALLKCIGANIKPDRVADSLSMPEQQLVEIAKAIGSGARILILDEPTASLSDHEVERLFRVIRALRGQGAGIVYISHRLEEIAVIADRITVLRDGEAAGTFAAGEIDRGSLIELMVGRKVASVFPKRAVPIGETALELHNVGCKEAGIRDVSLTLKRGEILGLAGLVGSGRTRLAETIFGLTPAGSGEIRVLSEGVRIASPTIAIERGIAYVPEDRQRHGVVLEMPILANASLASLNRVSRLGPILFT